VNCPFYGRAIFIAKDQPKDPPFVLFEQGGNQCGLITTAHSPCLMEMVHEPVDWKTCTLVRGARCEEKV
jgi:hypothetical protein